MTDRTNSVPTLAMRPERRLIRRTGSYRHVDFVVTAPAAPGTGRTPVRLALVLDRSGSMAGEKLATAKAAAYAVVDRLDERDRCAVAVFDDRVDVVQDAVPVTAEVKRRVRAELARIEARAQTALHEGWLTGARAIAGDERRDGALGRVFLLTDGLANVGETDPERIAAEALGIRENAAIGTSTFGIGADYNEALLGPMAVAGGGQFHHLRSPEEITNTFVGELGELFAVAARNVVLEIEVDPRVTVDVVSAYRGSARAGGVAVGLGDLIGGEERHVVVRFGFPAQAQEPSLRVEARVTSAGGTAGSQAVELTYADHGACDDEPRDPDVMRQVARQHAERAKREAAQLSRRGDTAAARAVVERVASRIAGYAGDDPELRAIVDELRTFGNEVSVPLAPMAAKAIQFDSLRSSRGQRDLRGA
jgi:Ca-activated chloride channel family protein